MSIYSCSCAKNATIYYLNKSHTTTMPPPSVLDCFKLPLLFRVNFFFISIDCAKSIDSKHDSEVFYHVFNFMTAIDRWRWSALSYFIFGIPPSPSSIFLRRCERCFGICCFINRVKLYWLLPELRYQKAFPTHESFIFFCL